MADLPVINALNDGFRDQTNAFKDSITRLQRSIRQGLALNRAEIVSLNETIFKAFNINEEMLELEKERMRVDNERYLEEKRKQKTQEAEKLKVTKGDGLGLLGALGIISGITAAFSAFTAALGATLLVEAKRYQTMFNSMFAKAFAPLRRLFATDVDKEVGGIRKAFRGFIAGTAMQFTLLADRAKELMATFRGGISNFFGRIRAFGAMLTNQGALFDDIARGFRAVVTPFINGIKFVIEPLRTSVTALDEAGDTAKQSVGVIQRVKDAISAFLTPFKAASSAFEPIIKIAKGLAGTIGRVFFPITILMGIFDVVTESIAGYEEGGFGEGLKRGFTALLDATIFLIPNLLKDAVSFVADLFGFENVSKALDSMSIGEILMEILSYPVKALGDLGTKIGQYLGLIDDDADEKRIREEQEALVKRRAEAEERRKKIEQIKEEQYQDEIDALDFGDKERQRQLKTTRMAIDKMDANNAQEIADIDARLRDLNKERLIAQKYNASPEELQALTDERDRLMADRRALRGAEIDTRSREVAAQASGGNVSVSAPQTNIQTDNSSRVNKTTIAPASPRRSSPSPQAQDYRDPLWVG